jgi:WD40 repeat protein/serine/threonine protein kinase
MGIVYEAEQESLGRRVALKILPAGALLDERLRQRFQREARAAARLHHTNIVPVFGVGEEGGLLYYVMQFIPGLGLDRVLAELRRLGRKGSPATPVPVTATQVPAAAGEFSAADVAFSLLSGPAVTGTFLADAAGSLADGPAGFDGGVGTEPQSGSKPLATGTDSASALSLSGSGRHYWKAVARIGVQVGEALDYAAGQGILHRDVKPSNLLLDLQGNVWVTDFGLAKATADGENLTHTGDIVGTLRYMAPERFEGRSDIRADIYSLGLTLYELLVQRPAFTETDRSKLIHQLTHEEPVPPRRLEPGIPRDLETIVLKAIARDPGHRYQRAGELAEDLRRFGEDRPVKARRVSGAERLWRWCKRNPALATLTAAVVVLLLAGTGISTYFATQAARRAEEALTEKGRADQQAAGAFAEKRRADEKAEEARQRAEDESRARREADDALTKARQAHAVSMLGQAQIAWRDNNTRQAGALLDEVPQDLRGWEWGYLKRLFRGRQLTLYGHTGPVWGVAFSPNGQRLATASLDQSAKVWDARTGLELLTLKGHTSPVVSVAFRPDGQRLATGSQDRTVRVWDLRTGQELLLLRGHTHIVRGVAFSPDGQRLASTSWDQTVRVWDAHTGKEALLLRGHTAPIWSVAFSPDGKYLASASHDQTAKIWDAQTGRELLTLKGHAAIVWSVAFSPDSKRLATGGGDQTVKVWEASSGRELLTLSRHTGQVMSVAFSPDGQRLATGSYDQMAKIWDLRTGQELLTLKGHTSLVWSMAFSPDGQRLATGGQDQTAKIWDVRGEQDMLTLKGFPSGVSDVAFSPDGQRLATAGGTRYVSAAAGNGLMADEAMTKIWDASTGQELLALTGKTGPVISVAFSPDGRRLATGSEDGTTKLWDAHSGQEILAFQGHTDRVRTVVFSPDGQRLVTASWDGTTKIWDTGTGQILLSIAALANRVVLSPDGRRLATADWSARTATVWDALSGQKLRTLTGYNAPVYAVAFSPDGRRLATTCGDGTARVCDAVSGQQLLILRGHSGYVDGVAYSPDGRRLATTSGDRTARIWDAVSGQRLLSLAGHTSSVFSVAFSPDGQRLATGSNDRTARIWDGRPVQEARALKGEGGLVNGVVFSPDGRRLATVGADQMAKIWDPGSGRLLLTLTGHTAPIWTAAFSSDGRRLASGSDDRTARIWDAGTGQPLHTFTVHGGWVSALAFSPDGQRLATGGGDAAGRLGSAQVWDLRTGRELHSLEGYTASVYRLVFSPDGQRLAATSMDGVTKVWEVQTWQEVVDPDAAKFVLSARDPALSPDGRFWARAEGEVVYLHDLKQSPNAEAIAFREALARPDPIWQEDQAARYERDRQWFAAAFHLDQALTARPDTALHGRRGRARAELSHWEEARADFARAVEEEPDQPDVWRGLALTQLLLKQPEGHRQTCARFLERFRSRPENVAIGLAFARAFHDPLAGVVLVRLAAPLLQPLLTARRSAARTVVLRHDAVAEPARLLSWTGGDPVVRGAVLCRAGRYDEAVQALGDDHDITALLYRALAEHGRGRDVAARAALQESEQLLTKSSTDDMQQTNAARLPWDRRAEVELLRAEVRALLPGQGP